jgi:hypothetical protein
MTNENFAKALNIVNKYYDKALAVARKHDLAIKTTSKQKQRSNWTHLLEIYGEFESEYRIQLKVSAHTETQTLYVWAVVTDCSTGLLNRYSDFEVEIGQLEPLLPTLLGLFDKWISLNNWEQKEPEWIHRKIGDVDEYIANLSNGWIGIIRDESSKKEARLYDEDGTLALSVIGDDVKELMRQIMIKVNE